MHIKKLGIIGTGLLTLALSGVPVLALSPSAHAVGVPPQPSVQAAQHSQAGTQAASNQPTAASKAAAGQLKACQNRQAAIVAIEGRVVARGQNQLNLFTTIAQRVEAFAAAKQVKVSDYSQQLATLTADQTKASNDLAAMKTNANFDCTSPDPKAIVNAFQTYLKQEISDLQTYRTDVKNLIVAVKTSLSQSSPAAATSPTTSSTAKPSTTSTGGKQ